MPTMTINMSAPTFGGVKKDYTFSGAISLPQVITAPIQVNSASLYFGWARCYYKNNYIGITIGGTHFYSEKFTAANDDTLRERTVNLVCDSVGADHLLKVQGRTVSFVIKNDSSSGTANVIDRPRDGDMILYLDYTVLETPSTLGLNTTVVDAGQYITPIITPGVGATSHKIVWQFGSRTEEKWDANAFKIQPEWLDQIPTSTSGLASATLTTYNASGAQIGSPSTAYFTINCPLSVVPTISSFTATRVDNGNVPAAWATYVQGKSGVNLAAVGAGMYGSWITSWLIQGDGKTAQAANLSIPTISGANDIKFLVTAIDSRGRSAQRDVTINVQPYSAPSMQTFTVARCDAGGALNPSGVYGLVTYAGTFYPVAGKNNALVDIYYKLKGAGTWTLAVANISVSGSHVIGGGSFAQTSAYDIQLRIHDVFQYAPFTEFALGTAKCFMDRLPGLNQLALFSYMPPNMPPNTLALPADGHLYFGDMQITDLFSNQDQLINGDFRFWQRGTNFVSGLGYGADRWYITWGTQMWSEITQAVFRFTEGSWNSLHQFVEYPSRFAGKTLTVSVSILWSEMPLYLVVDVYDAGENRTILADRNFGVVGGVQSLTFTVPTNITDSHKMAVRLFQNGTQTGLRMALKYVKLEIGNVATPHHPRPYGQELALCQRYYQIIGSDDIAQNPRIAIANAKQGDLLYMSSFGFTPMRVDPTPSYFNATNFAVIQSIGYIPISALYGVSTRNGIFTAAINSAYADTIGWYGKVAMVYKIGLNAEMY